MNAITFTKAVATEIRLSAEFNMPTAEFQKLVSNEMLKARTKYDAWNDKSTMLRALHKESYAFWRVHSTEAMRVMCTDALGVKDHREFCAVFAKGLTKLEAEYDLFCKKQAGLFTALGANTAMSGFVTLRMETAAGSGVYHTFDKEQLVHYIVGVGQYSKETRFNKDDARRVADLFSVEVDMAGLKALFHEHPVAAEAWEKVMTSPYTKERRKALLQQDHFTTRKNNNGFDGMVTHLPENKRYNPTNGEVHHLLSALLKQWEFGYNLARRAIERDLEASNAAYKALHTGGESIADWELGRTDAWGEEWVGDYELHNRLDELFNIDRHIQAALHGANKVLEAVHGKLAFHHIRKDGEFIKVTDRNAANALRLGAWYEKRDAQAAAEWETLTAARLDAIAKVMATTFKA
ncbi:hypothetical protein HNR62_000308 [Oceanisphaera litoralis]|uniref:hypothetical protein n=1 Tax=Oceanisphaera litoralis TaxID=225144 RepID=UPI0019565315|nr:hypothetical protein [Oceanisphaera litoralis]MBM7454479.1 hypothetical protein [Oceanisphaera litoralis]